MNPIPYNLLFERFLNPDRISMPDIDLDFNDKRREEVINYCREKYGAEAVSRIITFGTLGAKASILDMSRVYDKPVEFARTINKTIPSVPGITLAKAMDESPEFKSFYDSDDAVKEIVDIAMKVEGLPRNISQHACGVVISPSDVTDYCPQVYLENKDTGILQPTTQFTMGECEEIGLLKMDFLGLKTMTILQESIKDINEIHGLNMEIDDIPLNDVTVYEHISNGHTKGVFQLESGGMTSFMKQLFQDVHNESNKIKNSSKSKLQKEEDYHKLGNQLFERMIAGISLYRPGPMDEIPNYINGMLNSDEIRYDTPELEPILDKTYGVIVYQEQVMATVRNLAGFTKGQSDSIRKAMSKKIIEMLDEYKPYFIYGSGDAVDKNKTPLNIKGCVNNGISEETAHLIWSKMENFAKYAFNKSHAGGYGVIAVQTAWLAHYYPSIFMKANLNSYITSSDKLKMYLGYCNKNNLNILAPSVNKSDMLFTVEGDDIRFGLKGLKNVGAVSELIIKERSDRGIFTSYQEFIERMTVNYKINKRAIESLVLAGALDEFDGTRKAKIIIMDKLLDTSKLEKRTVETGQMTIFDLANSFGLEDVKNLKKIKTPTINEYDKEFKLEKEEESAGFYISEHPLDDYVAILKKEKVLDISTVTQVSESDDEFMEENEYIGTEVKLAGIISEMQIRYTKKDGSSFNTFTLKDRTGDINTICFPKQKIKNEDKLIEGKKVIINGVLNQNEFGLQLTVMSIVDLSLTEKISRKLVLTSHEDIEVARIQWKDLLEMSKSMKGNGEVDFIVNNKVHKFPNMIDLTNENMDKIREIFTEMNCKIEYI